MTVASSHHTMITVAGMTCEHCVRAVREELTAIDGVGTVDIDLESGRVNVHSDRELTHATIVAAVSEAGYQVA